LHLPVAVAALVFRAGSQLLAEEHIFDACGCENFLEHLAIELRIHPAIGLRSDIAHGCDRMSSSSSTKRSIVFVE